MSNRVKVGEGAIGMDHRRDDTRAGALGKDCILYLHADHTASLGRDVYAEWDGDNFALTSPHVGGTYFRGGPESRFINGRTGQKAPQVAFFRELLALPRGTRLPIPWEES